jgi:predicted phage terminase large subunit-like protein
MRKQGKRMEILETPALDPVTDESNFEYIREGKRVFTTQYFRDQRSMLTAEQFESEFQQQPFEAKGLLFPESKLNRFFELPVDREPDTIMSVCDTAEKGSDYCAMPIAALYGADVYIIDVVFDDSPPEVTKPEVAKALIDNKVISATFESNNAGTYFARDVGDILKDRRYECSIRTKRTITNKQTRIEFASDTILKNFYFLDASKYERNSQYAQFIKNVITYTRSGKVPHDDAPDSLSLLVNELRRLGAGKVEVIDRPF